MRSRTRGRSAPTTCWPRRSSATAPKPSSVEKRWAEHNIDVPLEIVRSPERDVTGATLRFVDELEHRWENAVVNVVIPELYVQHWWQQLLHNQGALWLKGRLLFRKDTVVTSIPYGTAGLTSTGSP